MDLSQLYAPPVATAPGLPFAPAVTPDEAGPQLSEQDWQTVGSLAKWMRFVSVFYFLGAAWMALAVLMGIVAMAATSLSAAALDPWLLVSWLSAPITAALLALGGLSLRRSAKHFCEAIVAADDALARGFRQLRRYLLIYGVWVAVQLISTLGSLLTS